MTLSSRLTVAAAAAIAAAGAAQAAQQPQQVTGPTSVYWVSAATTSGMGALGGGQPDMSQLMGQFMGRGGGASTANHSLTLQLGSSQRPTGAPSADHTASPALRAGPVLPLITPPPPTPGREPPRQPGAPLERPRGKMLIFWGCGEHAGPGQPLVIDFSTLGTSAPMPAMPSVNVRTEQPPSPDRFATYGEWPNQRSNAAVPPNGSLLGASSVRSNYGPPIAFNLAPGQDFLPALTITGSGKTAAGGSRVTWNPVQGALGYFANLVGGGGGQGGTTVVMWSSSSVRTLGAGLMDYLPPSEVRRLVGERVVMSPQTAECVVPAEVTAASPVGMLSMIAYGDEVDFVDPPRPADPRVPWKRNWTAKVRFKATTGIMLGMPGMGGFGDAGDEPPQRGGRQQQQQQQQQPRRGGGLLRGLGGLGGIPIP